MADVRLGDVVDVVKGISYRSSDYTDADGGLPFINLKCVGRGGGFRYDGIKYYAGTPKADQYVDPGDILIANTDLTQNREVIGSPIVIPDIGGVSCFSLDLSKLKIKRPDMVDGRWLFYYLKSAKARSYMISHSNGSTVSHLNTKSVPKMGIDLPDMATQRRIADILGTLDDKIELNRQMNETLEQIGQALFRHYFIDNPDAKNWELLHISDLGTVITGKTPPKSNVSYYGEDIPFLKVPDMHGNCIVTSTEDGLSVDGADSQSSKYIPPMSTCVSCIATVGEVSLSGTRMQTNQQINSIIPVSPEYTFFNYFLMRSMSAKLKSMASGATAAPNLNKSVFSYIKVSSPNRSLLCEFHNTVTPLFDKILNNVRELTMLSSVRDSLMSHLI